MRPGRDPTTLIQSNPFVIVISLDFSKAFDTVRYCTLLAKMAGLELPVSVYNWLVDFSMNMLTALRSMGKSHQRRAFQPALSRGRALDQQSAADLKPLQSGNSLVKFAYETYLVVPSANADTRQQEIDNIETWTAANNLKLNVSESKEIIFQDSRQRRAVTQPQPMSDISHENVLKILGVTITIHLSASEHIRQVISDSAHSLYAIRVLWHHSPQSCCGPQHD